jgi:hypothetical protein
MVVSRKQLMVSTAVLAVVASGVLGRRAAAEDFGTLSGQFVLQGDIPERTVIVKKGDQNTKDAAVCAADDLLSDEVIVDPETKGVANIFVWLRKAPAIHPDLAATPQDKKEVTFDQKGCRFFPHCLFLRTDQTVVVKSGDNCAHNTHTNPIRNSPQNFIVQANDRTGVKLSHTQAEIYPIPINCDIHAWMKAHWLILDHPYAAVTNDKGRFTIEKMPAGKHEMRVWHERKGLIFINKDLQVVPKKTKKGEKDEHLTVTIEGPNLDLGTIEVPATQFQPKS